MIKKLILLTACITLHANAEEPHLLEKEIMDTQNTSNWLMHVKSETKQNQYGQFSCTDKSGQPLILEWEIADILSPKLATFKKNICDIACQSLALVEVEFLRQHPDSVTKELFLQGCAPLFEKGLENVNWDDVLEKIQSTMKQFYHMDMSHFGDMLKPLMDDIYILVTVKNSSHDKPLAFAMFSITPALPFGNVKVINCATIPSEKDRELEKLLMSSIFTIVPDVERLFILTRPTDTKAIKMFQSWGFIEGNNRFDDPIHKFNKDTTTLYEYRIELSETLQNTAEKFVKIKN